MDFVYKHIHDLKSVHALASYLRTMTVRKCVRMKEIQSRHQQLFEQQASDQKEDLKIIENIDRQKHLFRLKTCMGRLKQNDRNLIRMRYFHEMTLEQVGIANAFSKQHARQQIARSLKKLKQCMEKSP